MSSIELTSGHAMPLLGLGTWRMRGAACEEVVQMGLEMGYRHLDTAYMYENQVEVGRGLRASGVARDKVFVATKIWHDALAYEQVQAQFAACLEMLEMDYVDLLLIHHPTSTGVPLAETLKAFDEIAASGKARSIGVSNFPNDLVDEAQALATAPIVNNQFEFHTGHERGPWVAHCQARGVSVTAHRPLAKGDLAGDGVLAEVGARYGKSAAQVALRWLVQQQVVAIPKASSEGHLRDNMDIFDWALEEGEMERLSGA